LDTIKGHRAPIAGILANPRNPREFVSYSHDHSFMVWQLLKKPNRKRKAPEYSWDDADAELNERHAEKRRKYEEAQATKKRGQSIYFQGRRLSF
jgi:hypothetical protein